ncbi:MAG: hypothetical protein Kow0022_04020 [Phycisphaerales bacterium]
MPASNLIRTLTCVIWLTAAPIATSQPTPAPPDQPAPEMIRARVQARLERTRESLHRLEKLLARLDAGEEIDPGELNELMQDRPFRERPGEGEWRSGGLRDGEAGQTKGGPGPGPGRLAQGEPAPPIAPEEIEKFVTDNLPWLDERLDRIGKDRPELRKEMLGRLSPQITEIMRLRRSDPELARLRTDQFRLGADWMEASRRIREQLHAGTITQADAVSAFTELAARHFELRQQITRHEIDRLRSELADKERELNEDDAKREEWIHDMAQRMVDRLARTRGPRSPDDADFNRDRGPEGRSPAGANRGKTGGRP